MLLEENKDFMLIPRDDNSMSEDWDVRIESGPYTETVIRYAPLQIDEENDCLKFSFTVQYSPIEYLNENDSGLQELAGQLLSVLMENEEAFDLPQNKFKKKKGWFKW
jgi:hypothetical protein